ncbi:MAG: hypothetical protein IPH03_13720 [Tetrasphaera sp.]|nr:hypothetical protein [Tetrasphaera sp.]
MALSACRPGWHIECNSPTPATGPACSLTSRAAAATPVFPHHEMSAAQARAVGEACRPACGLPGDGRPDGDKRSKVLGNLVPVLEAARGLGWT